MMDMIIVQVLRIDITNLIIGGIIGAVFSFLVSLYFYKFSNKRKSREQVLKIDAEIKEKSQKERPRLDYKTEWISEWRTDYYKDSEFDYWVKEKLRIEPKGEKIYIKNFENLDFNYEGYGEFYNDMYFFGIWNSIKSKNSSGVFTCVISTQSDFLYGYFTGKNSKGSIETGVWVIAQNENKLLEAKNMLKDPNYLFKTDSSLNSLRIPFHIYHQTHMGNLEVWRHNIIDFSKIFNNELLIGRIKTTNKKGNECVYQVQAIKSGSHFVWILMHLGAKEEPSIWIFPNMFKLNDKSSCGLSIGENWDKNQFIGKIVISTKEINKIKQIGTLPDELKMQLNKYWNLNFLNDNILPSDFIVNRG